MLAEIIIGVPIVFICIFIAIFLMGLIETIGWVNFIGFSALFTYLLLK